ncbi:MAG: GHKL domain-containing protein, partial [Bacteroidota bacterium]
WSKALDQELTYLEDFIELEELRQDHNFELELRLPPVDTSSYLIAPFLLMPFVENAFKHLSQNPREKNRIVLHIDLQNGKLLFSISNSTSITYQKTEDILSYGGIGLKNVKRRLDLIYQDQYELHIDQQEDFYEVKLELALLAVGSKQLIQ